MWCVGKKQIKVVICNANTGERREIPWNLFVTDKGELDTYSWYRGFHSDNKLRASYFHDIHYLQLGDEVEDEYKVILIDPETDTVIYNELDGTGIPAKYHG